MRSPSLVLAWRMGGGAMGGSIWSWRRSRTNRDTAHARPACLTLGEPRVVPRRLGLPPQVLACTVAQRERYGLAEEALQPRADREGTSRREYLVELAAAFRDHLGDVLSEGRGPGESRPGPREKHRGKGRVPPDDRGEVLAHADEPRPEVSELDRQGWEVRGQIGVQPAHDSGGRTTLMSGVHGTELGPAQEQAPLACDPEVLVDEVGVPDHEVIAGKDDSDLAVAQRPGN